MMNKLLPRVRMLVGMELTEARKNNGDYFHSAHEGYGVLMEELDEARYEDKFVKNEAELLLYSIRKDYTGQVIDRLDNIEEHAILAACEYIQVAAMARKMREGLERAEYEEACRP